MENFNQQLFLSLNQLSSQNPVIDKTIIFAAQYFILLTFLTWTYIWFKKDKDKNIVIYSLYSTTLGMFANKIIASLFFHPRPFMVHTGKLLIAHAPETSFPSDHTTFVLSAALIFLYFKNTRFAGFILFFIGLLEGLARIYCGLHFPFDILGSALVSFGASFIVFRLKKRLQFLNKMILLFYDKFINFFKKTKLISA